MVPLRISPTTIAFQNITIAIQQLAEKALHLVILYNSEILGHISKRTFNNWDKSAPVAWKVHLQFCKIYLRVNSKASNIASICSGELGKLPLLTNIHKRLFKFVIHLNMLTESSIEKQAFLISKDLIYLDGKVSFYSKLIGILTLYDHPMQLCIRTIIRF